MIANRTAIVALLTGLNFLNYLDRFIVACVRDETALPYFLQNTLYLQAQPRRQAWLAELGRSIRDAPRSANERSGGARTPPADVAAAVDRLGRAQYDVLAQLDRGDLAGAKAGQAALDPQMKAAEKTWRFQARILNLAG